MRYSELGFLTYLEHASDAEHFAEINGVGELVTWFDANHKRQLLVSWDGINYYHLKHVLQHDLHNWQYCFMGDGSPLVPRQEMSFSLGNNPRWAALVDARGVLRRYELTNFQLSQLLNGNKIFHPLPTLYNLEVMYTATDENGQWCTPYVLLLQQGCEAAYLPAYVLEVHEGAADCVRLPVERDSNVGYGRVYLAGTVGLYVPLPVGNTQPRFSRIVPSAEYVAYQGMPGKMFWDEEALKAWLNLR